MFSFLNSSNPADTIVAALISAGGTILMLIAQKQKMGVKKTRSTAGLSEKFMWWQCVTCVLLGLTSVFGIVGSAQNAGTLWKWIVIDGLLILMNGYLFYSNFFTYKIKQENMKTASLAKMTEGEHYEKVIAPSLLKVAQK